MIQILIIFAQYIIISLKYDHRREIIWSKSIYMFKDFDVYFQIDFRMIVPMMLKALRILSSSK